MGAQYASYSFPPEIKSHAELQSAYQQHIRDLIYEYGHDGYNGTLSTCSGLSITDKVFDDPTLAENWVEEHAEKWDDALAVRVKHSKVDLHEIYKDPKIAAAGEVITRAGLDVTRTMKEVLESMQKSQSRTCPRCKSRVSMNYTNEEGATVKYPVFFCKVCEKGSLLKKGEAALYNRAKLKETKAQEALNTLRHALVEKARKTAPKVEYWYVGGLAAS